MAILADNFFHSYDLLPAEYKKLIWDSPTTPTMEDLETVWKIVEDSRSFNDLVRSHAKKYDPERAAQFAKEERDRHAEERKNRRAAEREARFGRWIERHQATMQQATNNYRLISANTALNMVTRKEAKVAPGAVTKTIVWVPETRAQRVAREKEEEKNKLGYDPYAAPKKNTLRAGTNKRLGNSY